MNYSSEFQNKIFTKLTGISLLFLALFLTSLAIFFSQKATSQAYNHDCADDSISPAQPGNNCLFLGKPLCQRIDNTSYAFNDSSITTTSPAAHRRDCADLSDLPLCSQIDSEHTANPGKNCVRECSDPLVSTGSGIRGENYAVHNKDCVRFCDAIEPGVSTTISLSKKCSTRRCHQVANGVTPSSSSCEFMDCDLLTSDELNEPRLLSSTSPVKYCNGNRKTLANGTAGDPIKCFDFKAETFNFIRFRGNNDPTTQCQIHNCRATSETCLSYSSDDVHTILAKNTDQPGFSTAYQNKFNNGYDIATPGALCTPVTCRPVVKRYYSCTLTSGAAADSVPDVAPTLCESTCSGGVCYRNIDCNLAANASEDECASTQVNSDGSVGTNEDSVNSWFYRPKPMNKAYDVVGTTYNKFDRGRLCYHESDMEYNGFGYHDLLFGLYYHNYLAHDTRSPPLCGTGSDGNGGYGYGALCGANGDFYSEVNDQTAYISGYVKTTFSNSEAVHTIRVCLRFNNNMIPWKTCGKRECGITCSGAFGCASQVCGVDSCYDISVKDSEAEKCMMNSDNFSSDNRSYDCLQVVEGNIRIRAVKYNNQICAFLDTKGTTAWPPNDDYIKGDKKLLDGITCYSGHADADGNCVGSKNSNDDRGLASRWRAIRIIPYIQNNQPSGKAAGYLDVDGRLFPAQECIKTSLRIPPLKAWNLSNPINSNKLFIPPLKIDNVYLKRNGSISVNRKTDFHYPQIDVLFGTTTQALSLSAGKTGYETSDKDPNATKTISSVFFGFTYSIDVFVRKEFNETSKKPLFCLYKKVKKADGTELDPIQIDCVERNLPEINNASLRALDSSIDTRRITLSSDSANTFRSSKIIITYTAGDGANLPQVAIPAFGNTDRLQESCDSNVEKYKICIQRDYCSALESECAANEVDLFNATSTEDIQRFSAIKNNCETNIVNTCRTLEGKDSNGNVIINNAYGWFNELCITKGFETKLRTIRANKLQGLLGKCIIDTVKSATVLATNSHACDSGGNIAIGCYCAESSAGVDIPEGQIARKETPHEAGLCITLPRAQRCSVIDYNTTLNTANPSDSEFINHSLGKSLNTTFTTTLAANYSATTPSGGVHLSHRARSLANPFSSGVNASLISHAEFSSAIAGMVNVPGICNGYWQKTASDSGEKLTPTMDCIAQASGEIAAWSSIVNNDCSRYICPRILTNPNGIEENGSYQNGYGVLEVGEDKGLNNGFATWPEHTQISDFAENQIADSCIPGFKRNGASTTVNTSSEGISSLVSGNLSSNITIASLYNRITGYSGGTLPSRKCNQNGVWAAFDTSSTNICRRLSCPEINDTKIKTLSTAGSSKYWELWRNAGGADFAETNASRSKVRNNEATGACNTTLGFFQVGTTPPKRACDYLGNWQAVTNPCTTKCDAIDQAADAGTELHGFAYWKRSNLDILSEAAGEIDNTKGNQGCVTGYIPYPYPPLKTNKGAALTLADAGPYRSDSGDNANLTTIPRDVKNDTRQPTNPSTTSRYPERSCVSMTVTNADGVTVSSNVWSQTSSSCINKCPGSTQDPRVNVGKTLHTLSDGTVAEVLWQEQDLNTYQAQTNCDGPGTQFSAATFTENRTNGCYLLRRKCNANGKWSDPEPMCAAVNGGQIGNATYSVTNPSRLIYVDNTRTDGVGNAGVAGSATRANGTCINNHWASRTTQDANRQARALPQRTCAYGKNADGTTNTFIDKVYWKMTGSSYDCEEITCLPPNDAVIYDDTFNGTATANSRAFTSITESWPGGTVREFSCSANGEITYMGTTTVSFFSATINFPTEFSTFTLVFGQAPTTTCRNTGTTTEIGTWGPVQNATNCRRSCTVPNEPDRGLDADDCGGGINFRLPSFTLAHNEVATFTACDACTTDGDEGFGWWFHASCNDGVPTVTSTWEDHSENYSLDGSSEIQHMCPIRVYDGANWTTVLNSPNGDTGAAIQVGNQRGYVRNNLGTYRNGSGNRTRLSNARDVGGWTIDIDPAPAP